MPETEAIFEHLWAVHDLARLDPHTLRISVDTKAKVKMGEFSRRGRIRGLAPVKAADHDMHAEAILAPAGILENHWNGALLTSVATAFRWAGTMTWRGIHPLVELLTSSDETGVKLSPSQYRPVVQRLERSETLGKWSLVITPNTA